MAFSPKEHWLIRGDLNLVFSINEKIGGVWKDRLQEKTITACKKIDLIDFGLV